MEISQRKIWQAIQDVKQVLSTCDPVVDSQKIATLEKLSADLENCLLPEEIEDDIASTLASN